MLKNYKYYLENLDCANCAKKIENTISKSEGFKDVVVNFNTLTLSFKSDLDEPFKEVVRIIKKIEPDIRVYQEKNNNTKNDYELV